MNAHRIDNKKLNLQSNANWKLEVDTNFVVTGDTAGYLCDNMQSHQWRRICRHKISTS